MKTESVRSGNVSLAVQRHGDSTRPTIVLLHGFPDTCALWDRVVAHLIRDHDVVTYEVRGAGASSRPASRRDYSMQHLKEDLVAVLDHVAPRGQVHLVGHDWGSIQLWESVADPAIAPRIASFTSISGPSLDHAGRWMYSAFRKGRFLRLAKQGLRSWYLAGFRFRVIPELVWQQLLGPRWPKFVNSLERIEPTDAYPAKSLISDAVNGLELYRSNLGRVTSPRTGPALVPVQAILGRRDPFITRHLYENLADMAPRAWYREVEGRHWLPRTHPAQIAEMVAELVAHIEFGAPSPDLERTEVTKSTESLVVVTGAGNGIGRSTALAFADRGSRLVVCDIDGDAAERTAMHIRNLGHEAEAYEVDVSDAEAMERFAKAVQADHGVPAVVVNNAGMGMNGAFLGTSLADWDRILGVNLWGVIHGCRFFGQQMVDAGKGGHLVNLASGLAFAPMRDMSAYSTTKAAVLMLSESLRIELADHNIGVSAICPGVVDSGITDRTAFVGMESDEQATRRKVAGSLYRRRNFSPDKVGRAIFRAVERNTAVVPVAIEARVGQLAARLAPGLTRRAARIDVLKKLGGSK